MPRKHPRYADDLALGFQHRADAVRFLTEVRERFRKFGLELQLLEVKEELWRRLHHPVPEVGKWLASVVRGHLRYYGVPDNWYALSSFRLQVIRLWHQSLRRRSQRTTMTWERMKRLAKRWIPNARICHPYPEQRLVVSTRGRSPVR